MPRFKAIKNDECLSSWVSRNCYVFESGELDGYLKSGVDLDFDFSSPSTLRLLAKKNDRVCRLLPYFRASSTWLLPWENRLAYCLECMKEDVAAGGAPYWRKSWCYLHCPICVKHKQMLLLGNPLSVCLFKSWRTFFEECRGDISNDTKCLSPWRQSTASEKAVRLALRVQCLLMSAHRSSTILLPGDRVPVNSNDFLCFSRFLFEEFLLPRSRGLCADGVARLSQCGMPRQAREATWQDAINAGCSDCHAFCRIVALVLIGCVLKLFPISRFLSSRDGLELSAYVRCGTPGRIAECGIGTPKMHAMCIVELLLEGSSSEFKERLSDFVIGLSSG